MPRAPARATSAAWSRRSPTPFSDEPPTTAVSTGHPPLDEPLNGGLRDGEFILIGSRPSMGKTAFALNLSRNIAVNREPLRGGGRAVVVLDYLQIVAQSGRGRDDEGRHVSRVSAGLKQLAKELTCPVIALSQLNRTLEQRASKRPILAGLGESGTLEQDADIILFLYRDVIYDPKTPDPLRPR